jgi:dienelactone hydrolase
VIESIVLLPCNITTQVRYDIPRNSKSTFLLSSGYGNDQFNEAVQLAFIELLSEFGVGWVQYIYPERLARNGLGDLHLSTGVASLSRLHRWTVERSPGEVSLFGYSFGGNISLELALAEQVKHLVIVNAPFDYVAYRAGQVGDAAMQMWRETRLARLDYDGVQIPLGYRFIEEAALQDLERRAEAIPGIVHAFQAEYDAIIPARHILRLAENSARWTAKVVPGIHADHSFEHPEALSFFIREIRPLIERLAA